MSQQDLRLLTDSALLKLSLQRALLGEVTNKLKAITAACHDKVAVIYFYFEGEVTVEDQEMASIASAEVTADFSDEFSVEEKCFNWLDNGIDPLDFYVYLKK